MPKIVVVTGAGAGVGRATALEFARQGCDVALLSRDPDRLEAAAAELRGHGVRALPIPTDVADAEAVERAADKVEAELGPIDVWVNVAMATVFAPVHRLTAAEFQRGTAVTYLGQVHGTMAALKHMRPRNRGSIVCVGSALGYRSVPLQSIYCGAKFAIRGFIDSLRSELIHDKVKIDLTMVDLPAVNTPQFDWARNKAGRRAKAPEGVYQPEVAADAILLAATQAPRDVFVGTSTPGTIIAARLAPGVIDRVLARKGYTSQLSDTRQAESDGNLFAPLPGRQAARGRFSGKARERRDIFTSRQADALAAGMLAFGAAGILALASAPMALPLLLSRRSR